MADNDTGYAALPPHHGENKAGELASNASPANAVSMMPELPAPYEALLRAFGSARQVEGVQFVRDVSYTDANHAAFEAERSLRVALLAGLNQGAAS